MKKIIITMFLSIFFVGCSKKIKEQERMCSRIDFDKIISLFPKNTQDMRTLVLQVQDKMNYAITNIESVDPHHRTFNNTIRPYDDAKINFMIAYNVLTILSNISDDLELQTVATQQVHKLQSYTIQTLQRNSILYNALKEYKFYGKDAESKTQSVKRYIQKKLQKYEHNGMGLSVDKKSELVTIDQNIKQLEGLFCGNIVHDKREIVFSAESLDGLPEDFIKNLQKNSIGLYILPINFETFFVVMENCHIEKTRKEYFLAFGQRGYPHNETILKDLIQSRQVYAQMLGFEDFASYQVSDQMVKTSKGVEKFLWGMVKELKEYVDKDIQLLLQHMPPSVTLTKDGKIKPWDEAYVKSFYRKNYFNVNDYDVAEYFVLEHTLHELLNILRRVFNVEFEYQEVKDNQLWAPGIICYRVRALKSQAVIGYLLLDLAHRESKKDKEAYHMSILPAIKDDCNISCIGASLIVTNFTKRSDNKPLLLNIHDVATLLHELGHALHELLGATKYVDFAGTQVVKDFVEAPSQMLEFFLKQPNVLRSISKHYQTGKRLSQEQIDHIVAAQKFGEAEKSLKQIFLGLVSWYIFKEGHIKDSHKLIEKIFKKVFKHIAYEKQYQFEYAFTHLINYGASYYAYSWSEVIAADLFDYMHTNGKLHYAITSDYVRHILAPGGFVEPAYMVKKFLKRPFNHKAFFKQF